LKERNNDPTLRRELAGRVLQGREIYRDLGQGAASKQSYAEARRLYEALDMELPNDPHLQHGLAMALYRWGARSQAIPILEKLIDPEDPRYHSELGYMYNDTAIQDAKTDKAKELEFLSQVPCRPGTVGPSEAGRFGCPPRTFRQLEQYCGPIEGRTQRRGARFWCNAPSSNARRRYRLRPADTLAARFLTIQLNNVAHKAKLAGETAIALAAHRRRVEVPRPAARVTTQQSPGSMRSW